MPGNGLRAYGFHADDRGEFARAARTSSARTAAGTAEAGPPARTREEGIARTYLGNAFASGELPELTNPSVNGSVSAFILLDTDYSALKRTRTFRFAQSVNGVPVHGSLVTVELDAADELVSINSALGEPHGVSSVPALTPAEARELIHFYAGGPGVGPSVRLAYYYDSENESWHLAYIGEEVLVSPEAGRQTGALPVPLADFVIDAYDGHLIETLPRVCAADGVDELNRQRSFETSFDVVTSRQVLRDAALNIHTHDFAFQDVGRNFGNLPGGDVHVPPLPWNSTAVSAHANAEIVGTFLRDVLGRRGVDGRGGPMLSSVNCVWSAMGSNGREWANSFWTNNQVVYGQRRLGAGFRSFAAALDLVGHEFFHGVTQSTAQLVFKGQTGALNESYSDIFGVMIANARAPGLDSWRWEIGADTGRPLRDMSDPGRFDHPAHMSQFVNLPPGNDFGGVHINCGIHNRAAFTIITARDAQGLHLFAPAVMANLFYLGLKGLGPTALFADSRRSVTLQARTLFRNDPRQAEKANAIERGFDSAGI